MRAKTLHGPNGQAASDQGNDTQSREEPAISNRNDERFRHDRADAGEDIPHKVVQCDSVRGLSGHEFREHRGDESEYQHASDAEEEVGDHGDREVDVVMSGPAVGEECTWEKESSQPGI